MLSIGEFARTVELSVSAVRFYSDRGLLIPAATDSATGYRFYTEDQVPLGVLIRDLRLVEMSLAEIGLVIAMKPVDRHEAVRNHVRSLENRLSRVREIARALGTSGDASQEHATAVRSDEFARAITQVLPAAGRDASLPHLMCVLIEVKDYSVRVVATDSYRLAVRDFVPTAVGRAFSAVVAAAALRSWPEALAAAEDCMIDIANGTLTARRKGFEIRCATVPTEFPDYEPILRSRPALNTTAIVDRDQLLSLVGWFDGDEPIVVTASSSELAATRDGTTHRISAEVSGSDARIAINPRFAADAVEQAVGVELLIEIDDALRPLTFRSADDGTYTSMLMPVKLR